MNLNEIKELIDKIDSSNIAYFEVKVDNSYIKMDKSLTRNLVEEKKASNIEETEKTDISEEKNESISKVEEVKSQPKEEIIQDEDLYLVTSPMVGTFYESPGVGEKSYVSIGSKISSGDVLCIVEAMKLMNEVKAPISGTMKKLFIADGTPIKKGQLLMIIE